jgi:hypothetical protein
MMRFDDYWPEDDDEVEAHGPRQPVPDGTHNGRISAVQLVTQPWAVGDTNPSGDCLEVTVDVGTAYYTLRETVPLHWRGKLGAICDAARVPAPQRGVDWDESELEGCTVNVETAAAMSKAGKEYVRIAKWRTSAAAAGPIERPAKRAAAKPAARTQAAKVMESFDDDVPF